MRAARSGAPFALASESGWRICNDHLVNLPTLEKLQAGEKFPFATLVDHIEQTEAFWEWWWATKANLDIITRPEVIADDDPILIPTQHLEFADLATHRTFFDPTLYRLTLNGVLPALSAVARETFRERLLAQAATASALLPMRPQLIFTGGGYGSGKTTVLNFLALQQRLPVAMAHLVGADVFKQLVPEFSLIKAVGDGRASLTVQAECTALTQELFEHLIGKGHSFALDSSMSNHLETLQRILKAKAAGYELTMVAMLTPQPLATRQAMNRAKMSRRFPNATYLPKSHVDFLQHFRGYFQYFDEVMVFAKMTEAGNPMIVAEKQSGKELEVYDEDVFNAPQFRPGDSGAVE